MEGRPNRHESLESKLARSHDLQPGVHVSLEKIALQGASAVPEGSISEGTLLDEVRMGRPIELSSGARTSSVQRLEQKDGELLIHTETSVYRLKLAVDDIDTVETARGSVYRYLPDGTTQRFKKAEGREYDPQSAIVYVPDWEWVKANAPKPILDQLGENELIYNDTLLQYVQNPFKEEDRKAYIITKEGKMLNTNEEIKEVSGPIFLALLSKGKQEFTIPVSHTPRVGWMTFDQRRYVNEAGEEMRERHLGNAVTRIVRKREGA